MGTLLEVILQFQLHMSSQFHPERRAAAADGTHRKRRYYGSSGRSPELAPVKLVAT
jgi:hypothetical protein